MKILAISDQRLPEMLRQEYLRQNYGDAEFIISCGDMEPSYLEFVSTALTLPLFFVRGNHDNHYEPGKPGGQDLHMQFQHYRGLRLLGLEGSMYYNGKNVQYTEEQMALNILQLMPRLMIYRQLHGFSLDYLVTHSPARGIHDRSDVTHQGFRSFRWLLRWARPKYMIHGHVDVWDRRDIVETQYHGTRIININPKRVLHPYQDYDKPIRSAKKVSE
ncbi:MAG: metallophosphoesterase [Anaerolineales bacterium]